MDFSNIFTHLPRLVSEWETRKASQKPKPNENPLYLSPLAKKDKVLNQWHLDAYSVGLLGNIF